MKIYIDASNISEVVVNRFVKFVKLGPMFWRKFIYREDLGEWTTLKSDDVFKHEYIVHKIKMLNNREDMHCWLSGNTFNAVSLSKTDAWQKKRAKGLRKHAEQLEKHCKKLAEEYDISVERATEIKQYALKAEISFDEAFEAEMNFA